MKTEHKRKLEELDSQVDVERGRDLRSQIDRAIAYESVEEYQYYEHTYGPKGWPVYPGSERYEDAEKDLMSALGVVKGGVLNGVPDVWSIPPETGGRGMIHSLLDGKVVYQDGQAGKWLEAPENATIEKLVDAGVPDVNGGIVPRHIERVKYMVETLSQYENLAKVAIWATDGYGLLEIA